MKSFNNNENNNNYSEKHIISTLKFNGSLLGTVCRMILVCIVSLFSLGTFYAFLISYLAKWVIKNITYNGKYLKFKEPYFNYTVSLLFSLLIGQIIISIIIFKTSFLLFIIAFSLYNYYFIKLLVGNIITEQE